MKPRIKGVKVCSSNNYKSSKRIVTEAVSVKRYVMCFGKQIEITVEEARSLQTVEVHIEKIY